MPKSVFAAPFSTPVLTLHAQKSSGVEIGLLRPYPELSVYFLTKRIVTLGDLINGYFTSLVSYDIGDVFYSWLNQDSVQVDNTVQIPQFMLMDWRLKFALHEYATGTDSVFESDPCMSSHTFRD